MLSQEQVIAWTADGRGLFLYRASELPARIDRIDLGTGRRALWKELLPPDPAATSAPAGASRGRSAAGDRATGVPVLEELHALMGPEPYRPDLSALWRRLGVVPRGEGVSFDDDAPLAVIRRAIAAIRHGP